MRNKIFAGIAAIGLALSLSACGKGSVDIEAANAEKVEGAGNLWRLCDQSTLVYVSRISGSSDEYEAFFSHHCGFDKDSGKWVMVIDPALADIKAGQQQSEMNQQDQRDEK